MNDKLPKLVYPTIDGDSLRRLNGGLISRTDSLRRLNGGFVFGSRPESTYSLERLRNDGVELATSKDGLHTLELGNRCYFTCPCIHYCSMDGAPPTQLGARDIIAWCQENGVDVPKHMEIYLDENTN